MQRKRLFNHGKLHVTDEKQNYKQMKRNIKLLILITGLLVFSMANGMAQQKISLQEAMRLALENNPAVKAAKSQVDIAKAKTMQAKSTFYPQASFLSKYFYTNNLPGMYPLAGVSVPVLNNGTPTGDNIIMHPMAPYPNRSRDVMQMNLNIVYPIYAGQKRLNAVKSTEKLKAAYNRQLQQAREELKLKVKTAYYNNLFLLDVINVYNLVLRQLNQHLQLAKAAYKEGVRSEFDVLNFESKIEEFKHRLVEMEGNKRIAETALKNLLALPDSSNFDVEGNLKSYIQTTPVPTVSLSDIQNGNNKVKSLQHMKEALKEKEKIEAAGNLPTLFAFGNYHILHGMDFPPFDKTWRNGYAVGVGLKINLFDGNRTKGKVEEVKATMDKIKNYQKGLNLQLRFLFNKTIEDIQSLKAQQVASEDHLKVAEKAYEIAGVAYKNGVLTNIELNDAQLNMTKAKLSLLNIHKNLLLEYAQLQFLSGK